MDQLIRTLPAVVARAKAPSELFEAACIAAWNHIVGPVLRGHTNPLRLAERKLAVAVRDTVWKKQLESMQGELRFRLNSILGQPLVAFIEFKVQPSQLRHAQVMAKRSKREELPVPLELLSAATAIKDSDLRNSFVAAAVSCIRRLEEPPPAERQSES